MGLTEQLKKISISIPLLRSYSKAGDSCYQVMKDVHDGLSSLPLVNETLKDQLAEVQRTYETGERRYSEEQKRLRVVLDVQGAVREQLDALEAILKELCGPEADKLRAVVDSLYQRLMIGGIAEVQPKIRELRDQLIATQTKAKLVEELRSKLPDEFRSKLPALADDASRHSIERMREAIASFEKFAIPSDLRGRISSAADGMKKLVESTVPVGPQGARPTPNKQLELPMEGLEKMARLVDLIYEMAASAEILDGIVRQIRANIIPSDVRDITARLDAFQKLNAHAISDGMTLSEHVDIMLGIANAAENLLWKTPT